MIKESRKGQGTLEYILLITAVLVVLITLLGNNGYFAQKLNSPYVVPIDMMNAYMNKIHR